MSHGQHTQTANTTGPLILFLLALFPEHTWPHWSAGTATAAASEQFCWCASGAQNSRTATILDEHSVSVYSNDGSNSSVEGKSGDGSSDKWWAQRQLREACRQQLLTAAAAAAKRVAAGRSVLAGYNLLIRQHRTHCRCC